LGKKQEQEKKQIRLWASCKLFPAWQVAVQWDDMGLTFLFCLSGCQEGHTISLQPLNCQDNFSNLLETPSAVNSGLEKQGKYLKHALQPGPN